MLSYFKNLVKNHQSDIILILGIVLIALVSFGAGLLVSLQNNQGAIIIQNPTASIIKATEPASAEATAGKQGRLIGSVNSNKYHWPECSFGKRIAEQNQIWFESEEEAQNAGYVRGSNFEKYQP